MIDYCSETRNSWESFACAYYLRPCNYTSNSHIVNWAISNVNFNRPQTACRFLNETLSTWRHEGNELCQFSTHRSSFTISISFSHTLHRIKIKNIYSLILRLNFHQNKIYSKFLNTNEQHWVILLKSKIYFATHSTIYNDRPLPKRENEIISGYVQNCKSWSRLAVNSSKKSEPF